jgi:hypothetical protein
MKNSFSTAIVLVACLASWCVPARAADLDEPLHCDRSAHAFVAPLIDAHLIEPKPFRVEPNSINAFNPAHGADVKAFGFRVFAIVAFQKDDRLFRTGDGEPIASSAYGAVVWGGTDKVKSAVEAAHSNAIVHHVGPFVTAIFCQRD